MDYFFEKIDALKSKIKKDKSDKIEYEAKDEEGYLTVIAKKNGKEVGKVTANEVYVSGDDCEHFEPYKDTEFYDELCDNDMVIEIEYLKIDPSARGQGVGSELMHRMMKEIPSKFGKHPIFINAAPFGESIPLDDLISFYKKFGFKLLKKFPEHQNAAMYKEDSAQSKSGSSKTWYALYKDEWYPVVDIVDSKVPAHLGGGNTYVLNIDGKPVKVNQSEIEDLDQQAHNKKTVGESSKSFIESILTENSGSIWTAFEKYYDDENFFKEWLKEAYSEDNFDEYMAHYGYEEEGTKKEKEQSLKDAARNYFDERFEEWGSDFSRKAEVDGSNLIVYRCIGSDNTSTLLKNFVKGKYAKGYTGVGIYWAWDKDKAECHWGQGKQNITLKASVPLSAIDVKRTIIMNLNPSLGREEAEIRLKESSAVKLLGAEGDNKGIIKTPVQLVADVQLGEDAELPYDVWYHGRTVKDPEFKLSLTGQGEDRDGPGFYFSSDPKDSTRYTGPNGVLMKVTVNPRKLVSTTKPPKISEIKKLMDMSPSLSDDLTNWDENPKIAYKNAFESIMKHDTAEEAFQQVWIDFYRNHPEDYLKGLISLGYDGHISPKVTGPVRHLIIYNPDVIKVIETKDYADL